MKTFQSYIAFPNCLKIFPRNTALFRAMFDDKTSPGGPRNGNSNMANLREPSSGRVQLVTQFGRAFDNARECKYQGHSQRSVSRANRSKRSISSRK